MTLTELLAITDKDDGDALCDLTNEITSLNNKIREIQFKMFIGNFHYSVMFAKQRLEENLFKDIHLKLTYINGDIDNPSYICADFIDDNGNPLDKQRLKQVGDACAVMRENYNEIFNFNESVFGKIKYEPYILRLDEPLGQKIDTLTDLILSNDCKSIYLNAVLEGSLKVGSSKERKTKI